MHLVLFSFLNFLSIQGGYFTHYLFISYFRSMFSRHTFTFDCLCRSTLLGLHLVLAFIFWISILTVAPPVMWTTSKKLLRHVWYIRSNRLKRSMKKGRVNENVNCLFLSCSIQCIKRTTKFNSSLFRGVFICY